MPGRMCMYIAFMLTFAIAANAQTDIASEKPINPYLNLILEIENANLSLEDLMKNNDFISRLKSEGYNKDSLLYFLDLQKSDNKLDSDYPTLIASLSLIAKSYQDSIVLRWAPSSEMLWKKLNAVGYSIVRSEFEFLGEEK
ncbi:MAG: hypothetical protein H7X99_02305, partial [Saprospiraceae bacterium]|nr:hypothetical protein [Saprospiraceae bacterium]